MDESNYMESPKWKGIQLSTNGDSITTTITLDTLLVVLYNTDKSKMLTFTFQPSPFSNVFTNNQGILIDRRPFNDGTPSTGMSFEDFAKAYFGADPGSVMYLWVDIAQPDAMDTAREFKRIAGELGFEYSIYDTTRSRIFGTSWGTTVVVTSKPADQSGAFMIDGKDFVCHPRS